MEAGKEEEKKAEKVQLCKSKTGARIQICNLKHSKADPHWPHLSLTPLPSHLDCNAPALGTSKESNLPMPAAQTRNSWSISLLGFLNLK